MHWNTVHYGFDCSQSSLELKAIKMGCGGSTGAQSAQNSTTGQTEDSEKQDSQQAQTVSQANEETPPQNDVQQTEGNDFAIFKCDIAHYHNSN